MSVDTVDPREHLANRLLESSLRHSYDPLIEIDWAAPLDEDLFWMPPHRSSLYGTALWDGLSHRQRVELTKHEVASAAGIGIWFETILMQMLVRQYYHQNPTSRDAQYALTELGDECRHSVMFGRFIERTGAPVYRPGDLEDRLGNLLKATASGPLMYAATLLVEEVLDRFQREAAADESLQPLVRMVSRVHVVEEARHVRYARSALEYAVRDSGPAALAVTRLALGHTALTLARRLVHPRVYAAIGIEPAAGSAAARCNPHFRQTLRWSAEKAVATLRDLGLIRGPGALLWRRSHLI
ncbi:MAG: diiron oxygenase [Micromonosporaceae bacterium]|nr:diiron oxygenase [Micromonosporaceae bacterium]